MAFPKNLLNVGEELVLDLRPHWLYLFKPLLALVVAAIVGIGLANLIDVDAIDVALNWLVIAVVAVVAVWFGWTYLNWTRTMFVLTTDRIITRTGVFNKSGIDVPLDRVNTVFFSQKWYERIVGAGDLAIESAGERGTSHFTDIRKPGIVQKEIYVQIESNENRKFDRMRGPAAPPTPTASIPEQIEQLSLLHQRGVLSDAEFARKKAELLERM